MEWKITNREAPVLDVRTLFIRTDWDEGRGYALGALTEDGPYQHRSFPTDWTSTATICISCEPILNNGASDQTFSHRQTSALAPRLTNYWSNWVDRFWELRKSMGHTDGKSGDLPITQWTTTVEESDGYSERTEPMRSTTVHAEQKE